MLYWSIVKARVAAAALGVFVVLSAVVGCDLFVPSTPVLTVSVTPDVGAIPYDAQIVCSAPAGQYTYQVGGQTIGPTRDSTLDVVIDSMDWTATVTWANDKHTLNTVVTATGNNPRPTIRGIRINGIDDLWQLEPMQRTLIEPIVRYGGEWRIASISVTGTQSTWPFTVFYPPYQAGVCHAYWRGWIIENAAIMYPVYCSIETSGLPYSPTGLDEGYPTSYHNTNRFADHASSTEGEQEIPAQYAVVVVTVEDEFNRKTKATFRIPVSGCDFSDLDSDHYDK